MPNHVRNRLVIKADESKIKEVTEFLKGEPNMDGSPCYIDFNKIIPTPEALQIECSSLGDMGEALLNKKECHGLTYSELQNRFDEMKPEEQEECLKLGRQYCSNREKYGHTSWYDWCCQNWGTKWNAYNQERPTENEIWFDTAWSCVAGLIGKLSKKFPDVTFLYTWADEDTGQNCGRVLARNGQGWVSAPEGGSKEAYEIAFEMRPEIRCYYVFENGEYKYNDDFS